MSVTNEVAAADVIAAALLADAFAGNHVSALSVVVRIEHGEEKQRVPKSKSKTKRKTNKMQTDFIRARKKVEQLQNELDEKTAKLEELLNLHNLKYEPIAQKMRATKGRIVKQFSAIIFDPNEKYLTRKIKTDIAGICVNFLEDIAGRNPHESAAEVNANLPAELLEIKKHLLKEFYPKEYEYEFSDEADEEAADAYARRASAFGDEEAWDDPDLDGDEFNSTDPEERAFFDDLRRRAKRRPATAARDEKKSEQKAKSITAVYKQLARVFHPDLEQDAERKAEKEQLMKELTAAYVNNDLHTILKFELRWLLDNKEDVAAMSEEKLTTYTAALKEQGKKLKAQIENLRLTPRFFPLFAHGTLMADEKEIAVTVELEATKLALDESEILAEFEAIFNDRSHFLTRLRRLVESWRYKYGDAEFDQFSHSA